MEIWTGTADVTNGDATITVNTGDPLSDANCSAGSLVLINGVAYFVLSRTDTTSFELTRDYDGSTDTAVAMEISPVSEATANLVNLATIVARVQSQLNILDKNSQGLFYGLLGATGAADPGPGKLAFNNSTPASISEIYIDDVDANGRPVDGLIDLWTAGTVILVRSLASTAYVALRLPGGVSVESGYRSAEAQYVDHDGVLADGEDLSIGWFRVGEGLEIDAVGTFSGRSAYNTAGAGFVYLSTNGNGSSNLTPSLYYKNSAASGDWSAQVPFQGAQGDRGWSPRLAVASDGDRRVLQLVGYVGGEGTAPTTGVGQYIAVGGLDPSIANGVDLRGTEGLTAYQVAVAEGFVGDEEAWLASLVGASAYETAVAEGFVGNEAAWLISIRGLDGTDPGVFFEWDDGTTDADPGSGNIRANSADLASATFLYASKTNRNGNDISAFLAGVGTSTNGVKGDLTLVHSGSDEQTTFRVTGLTDATNYVKIALQAASHSGVTSYTAADAISLQFSRAGNQGSSDAASMASGINSAPEVADLATGTKFAVTDPNNGDVLSWVAFDALNDAIKPRSEVDNKSANYTILPSDAGKNINVDASAAARTITLLPAATAGNGFEIGIRKGDGSANTVTLDGDGSETINGLATLVLRDENEGVRLVCDGTAWLVNTRNSVADGEVTAAKITGDSGEIEAIKEKMGLAVNVPADLNTLTVTGQFVAGGVALNTPAGLVGAGSNIVIDADNSVQSFISIPEARSFSRVKTDGEWVLWRELAAVSTSIWPTISGDNLIDEVPVDTTTGWSTTGTGATLTTDGSRLQLSTTGASGISELAVTGPSSGDYIIYAKLSADYVSGGYVTLQLGGAGDGRYIVSLGYNWSTASAEQGRISARFGSSGAIVGPLIDYSTPVEIALLCNAEFGAGTLFIKESGVWVGYGVVSGTDVYRNTIRVFLGGTAASDLFIHELFIAKPNIVAIGDSITEGATLYSPNPADGLTNYTSTWMASAPIYEGVVRNNLIVNKGVGSETSEDTDNRLASVLADADPQLVFLQASANDYGASFSQATRTANIQASIDKIVGAGAKVALTNAIYPNTGGAPPNADYYREWWQQHRSGVTGVDIFIDWMAGSGILDGNYMDVAYTHADGVHPTPAGYALLGTYVASLEQ